MLALTDTEWAAVVLGAASIIAALVASPQVLRFDLIQRWSVLSTLNRLSPELRGFYDSLPGPTSAARGTFLAGSFATGIAAILIEILCPSSQLAAALWSYFFVIYVISYGFARKFTRGLDLSSRRILDGPKTIEARHLLAPAIVLRALIVMAFADALVYIIALSRFQEILSSGGVGVIGIALVFSPVYLFQTGDLLVATTGVLFRAHLEKSQSPITVRFAVNSRVGKDDDLVGGSIVSIGQSAIVRREDGYLEDVPWSSIVRVSARPPGAGYAGANSTGAPP